MVILEYGNRMPMILSMIPKSPISLGVLLIVFGFLGQSQPLYDYETPFLATSQLGFLTDSPKQVSFFGGRLQDSLPDEIPFYITKVGMRLPRKSIAPKIWSEQKSVFRWPLNTTLSEYNTTPLKVGTQDGPLYVGRLKRIDTRWGVFWQGDFTDFTTPGVYQLENRFGFSAPFQINDQVYERLERGYLEFMYSQRSGVEIPGIRAKENTDDAYLDVDSTYYMPVAGGWNDAGDWRKWLFLTLPNLDALGQLALRGHPAFRESALEEMRWGNQYFHQMITDKGQVYSDVGGGKNRLGSYGDTWWNENHPGVTAAGDLDYDNIPMNGIERQVRTHYNPLVQFQFVRHQALASTVFEGPQKSNSLVLADRAWQYGVSVPHDERTLFVAQQLLAAVELYHAGGPSVKPEQIGTLTDRLLERQRLNSEGLSGYFMEKDNRDGYRSIAFSDEPAMALLRLLEVDIPSMAPLKKKVQEALTSYIEDYLLADAKSNPFHIPPYGVYRNPPFPKAQKFREASGKEVVRTFIHVFSEDPMPHGTNSVFLQHGYLMARAGHLLEKPTWKKAAEKILHWSMGHNPYGLCLFTGVGFKHPIPASFMNYKIPSAPLIGFLGTPNDRPYLETQNLVEWSTQEAWDVPYYFAIGLISYLD